MAHNLKFRKKAKVLRIAKKQTGTSNKSADKVRQALKPGARVSRTGRHYFEARRNRSDRGKYL